MKQIRKGSGDTVTSEGTPSKGSPALKTATQPGTTKPPALSWQEWDAAKEARIAAEASGRLSKPVTIPNGVMLE